MKNASDTTRTGLSTIFITNDHIQPVFNNRVSDNTQHNISYDNYLYQEQMRFQTSSSDFK